MRISIYKKKHYSKFPLWLKVKGILVLRNRRTNVYVCVYGGYVEHKLNDKKNNKKNFYSTSKCYILHIYIFYNVFLCSQSHSYYMIIEYHSSVVFSSWKHQAIILPLLVMLPCVASIPTTNNNNKMCLCMTVCACVCVSWRDEISKCLYLLLCKIYKINQLFIR